MEHSILLDTFFVEFNSFVNIYLSNAYLIFNRLLSDKKNLDGFVKPASKFLKIQKLFTL